MHYFIFYIFFLSARERNVRRKFSSRGAMLLLIALQGGAFWVRVLVRLPKILFSFNK